MGDFQLGKVGALHCRRKVFIVELVHRQVVVNPSGGDVYPFGGVKGPDIAAVIQAEQELFLRRLLEDIPAEHLSAGNRNGEGLFAAALGDFIREAVPAEGAIGASAAPPGTAAAAGAGGDAGDGEGGILENGGSAAFLQGLQLAPRRKGGGGQLLGEGQLRQLHAVAVGDGPVPGDVEGKFGPAIFLGYHRPVDIRRDGVLPGDLDLRGIQGPVHIDGKLRRIKLAAKVIQAQDELALYAAGLQDDMGLLGGESGNGPAGEYHCHGEQ